MADHGTGPVKVTVSDPETGKIFEEKIVSNDYVLICNGSRYLKSVQVMGKTHILAVAWDRSDQSPQPNVAPDEDAVETVARRIYEDAHKGMSNIWSWNDRGLDDEHPGTRERYLGYARSAIAATPPPVQHVAGRWLPIEQADRTINHVTEFTQIGLTLKNSDTFWVRDEDGRVYQAAWSEGNNGRDYWWDWEAESPVDPVEFMPHPLDPRFASTEGQDNG